MESEKVEQLFRHFYPKMLLVARMMLGDQDEARDLVGDVFAEMLSGKMKIPSSYNEGYFIVLVRNRCLNMIRKMATRDKVRKALLLDTDIKLMDVVEDVVIQMDQEVDKLDEMLAFIEHNLTPQTALVMNMHYCHKMTYRQIAAKLAISETAVYKHLAQGIKRIKEHFNPKNNG